MSGGWLSFILFEQGIESSLGLGSIFYIHESVSPGSVQTEQEKDWLAQ